MRSLLVPCSIVLFTAVAAAGCSSSSDDAGAGGPAGAGGSAAAGGAAAGGAQAGGAAGHAGTSAAGAAGDGGHAGTAAAGAGGSGGSAGSTSNGGSAGSTSDGGSAGSTSNGGSAGSPSNGGSAGSTSNGGSAGSTSNGGEAGSGGNAGVSGGGTGGSAGDTGSGGTGGASAACTDDERKARWAAMLAAPIVPPYRAAGLDLTGKQVTIEDAEKINCASTPAGLTFGDGDDVNQWGDNGEVFVKFDPATRVIHWLVLNPGYTGTISFTSRDAKDAFEISLGKSILKNGQPYFLDWLKTSADPGTGAYASDSLPYRHTAMADGMFSAWAPSLSPEDFTSASCVTSGRCVETDVVSQGILRTMPLALHLFFNNPDSSTATPYTPVRIDLRVSSLP